MCSRAVAPWREAVSAARSRSALKSESDRLAAGRRAPDGLDTRPTTDRVREAVFNSLVSMDLIADAEVVDLFAGTGALGIEALSRGAARCRFVEKDREALRILRANLTDLGLERSSVVLATDVMAAAASLGPCDLVLADPPYQFDAWPESVSYTHLTLPTSDLV